MCVPGCHEAVREQLSRRNFIKQSAALGIAAGVAGCASGSGSAKPAVQSAVKTPRSFTKAVDLTHTLSDKFPTYSGKKLIKGKSLTKLKKDGYTTFEWTYSEHIGTHIDAPIHFSDSGISVDQIPVEQLVVPLAIVDIRQRAVENADTQLTPDDINAFEAAHGEIPRGACVAMLSGWDAFTGGAKFRNADAKGGMHFPGFHLETVKMLEEQRGALGIAVDTLSLDYGQSKDFAVHYNWLPAGRWGLECVANLASLPPIGATIVVGAPTIAGATGGPSRIIALV